MKVEFGTREHQADVAVYGRGPTLESAFEGAALALCNEVVRLDRVSAADREFSVEADGYDAESLLLDLLNQINAHVRIARMAVAEVTVGTIDRDHWTVTAKVRGADLDWKMHQPEADVKAATACGLAVERLPDGRYEARCVLDV